MKDQQQDKIYDVIIAGGGPVGLFLACELALAKCSVLVLEKAEGLNSPIKQLPFGVRGLSAPSIEALHRRDMLQELEIHKRMKNPYQNAVEGPKRQVGHFAGIPFLEGNVDRSQWKHRLPSSTETSLISEIQELETIFTRRGLALGAEIKYGFAVSDFEQIDNIVTVKSNDETFKSKWLVGCDGSRSIIRKNCGIVFAGTEPEFTGYSTRIDITDPEKLKPGRNVTPHGMYMQSQPGYVIIQDFDGGAFHGSDQPLTLEHVQEVLRLVSGTDVTINSLHFATTWTDRARQATAYRKGHVLLAGDAAHIHAPLGGQGLNLGLGDAMNLGWKLAAMINNNAPEVLLDSYFNERYPIGEKVLDWSRAQVEIMNPDPAAKALNAIMRDLINTTDGATYFAGRVWGINTHYDLGGGHPLTGHSVPNFEFEDGTTIGKLMHEGHGILLDFDNNINLKALANGYGNQIKYISAKAIEQFGLSALLIRPDGYIAWAGESSFNINDVAQVAACWFIK